MDEVDFYLEDLKSKFDKINPKEYQFLYYGGTDNILYWFITENSNNNDITMILEPFDDSNFDKNKKNIYGDSFSEMETCFDKKGNFYPLHDLDKELEEKIKEKYKYEQS